MLNKKILKRDLLCIKTKKQCPSIKTYKILLPSNFKTYFFKVKNKNLYHIKMFDNSFFICFSLLFNDLILYFDNNLNILSISRINFTDYFNAWLKNIYTMLFTLTSFFFCKIKFKGKGYYLYKNVRNTITPQFGYSHRIYFYSFFLKTTFLTKTKIFFFGFNKSDLLKTILNLKSKRSINIFTGRGVRFARQIVYKKTGKVSSYR